MTSNNTRIAAFSDIQTIASDAAEADYNRRLSDEILAALDPDGQSLLAGMMIHKHAAGVPVEPHVRAIAYLKLTGKDEPVRAVMDIPMDRWSALSDATISFPSDPRNG